MVLSSLIFMPITFGAFILFFGNKNLWVAKGVGLFVSALLLFYSLVVFTYFDTTSPYMQFVERSSWISLFGIEYYLGVDGISILLIVLTALTNIIVVIASFNSVHKRMASYIAAVLMMAGLMNGVFAALDSILFYVFWEAMLIPMYLIIGIWGGERRVYASIKFFLYTFLGSVLLLVAIIYLKMNAGSFDILKYHKLPLSMNEQIWIFLAFFAAFAVKIPMFPVHTWLPDAHVEAPTGGSVILAAVMLKMGAYGFLRFSLPITPDASLYFAPFIITLSLIAVMYIGFVALVQTDMKKLIAYSSISHMGFVTLGSFLMFYLLQSDSASALLGVSGAMVQVLSHGLISAAMFLCVGVLYDRMHSRKISDYGGVINKMPIFGAFFVFFAMANAGLPGTSGFVGEFMVILASFEANLYFALIAATTLIVGAAYSLWMVKRVIFGQVANQNVEQLSDLKPLEFLLLATLAILILAFGVYPAAITDVMDTTLNYLLNQVSVSKL